MDLPMTGAAHPATDENALTPELKARFEEETSRNDMVLYMKGTPQEPQCGFSARAAQVLEQVGKPYHAVNVFEEPNPWQFVQALAEFADFPTLPQVWVKGELVGGSDIALELFESGQLQEMLKA